MLAVYARLLLSTKEILSFPKKTTARSNRKSGTAFAIDGRVLYKYYVPLALTASDAVADFPGDEKRSSGYIQRLSMDNRTSISNGLLERLSSEMC